MDLKNFDEMLNLVPKKSHPLRAVLVGSDGENMLKGVFEAQKAGFIQPVLVGDRARTIEALEKLGLEKEPYTMVDTIPGHNMVNAAIDIVKAGEGDILMRGNMLTRDFMLPIIDKNTSLRTDKMMSHVSLASMPEYPKLIALSDMAVIIRPDINRKRVIIQNTTEVLKALGYEKPTLALLSLVETGTFHMQDTVEAQSLVYEHTHRRPIADCELWGPISYDLIISKEAARLKNYDCPYTGGGFDGIIAPELTTANTLCKSWLIHAHSSICGTVVGAQVPIALTSRSASDRESFLSLAMCAILDDYYKKNKK